MIRTLLRVPAGPAETVADVIRGLAIISIVIAGIGWGPLSGLSFVAAFAAMLVPRLLALRPSFDILFGAMVLAATWSSVLGVYITTRWWDIPMHFLTNGLCAALLYIVLVRLRVFGDHRALPHPMLTTVVTTTALGLSLAVLWEFFEWYGHNFIDDGILVGYEDSLGDLLAGGLGSLLAGFGIIYFMSHPASHPPASTPSSVASNSDQ